jgi:UDP-glucose 4-epimerase
MGVAWNVKCVILGGGGFIGSSVADRLLLDGHSVRIFERPGIQPYREFGSNETIQWMSGDLLSVHDVEDALKGTDMVVHAATTTLPKSSNDDPVYDVRSNLVAAIQILNAMVKLGVPKIIFLSSGGTIYGAPKYLPIDEAHPTDPIVSMGINKLAVEKYILMYRHLHGITPVILRVSNAYGQRQRVDAVQGAVAVFMHRATHGLPIDIWGDGSAIRDFVYVGDLADALARSAHYTGRECVFNVGSGVGTALRALIALIEQVLDRRIERRYLPARDFDVRENVLSSALIAREMGWKPEVQLHDGLKQTAKWIQQAPHAPLSR